MQKIANEMNLSETAFLVPKPGIHGEYDLRWFTPTVEMDLCGHATLASGHVVLNHLNKGLERVTFHTRSGALGVDNRNGLIELDFPSNPPTVVTEPDEISAWALPLIRLLSRCSTPTLRSPCSKKSPTLRRYVLISQQ